MRRSASEPVRRARAPGGPRLRGQPEPRGRARHRGRHRVHRALAGARHDLPYETDGVVVKVDRVRPAGAARDGQPGAALGDRLQVPARAGRDRRRGHRPVRRPDRDAHARRPPPADQGRRLDGRPGDPPQPRRGPAQGHPDRRSRDPPEGGRRHPGGRPADRRAADRCRARVRDAGRLPGLRHARSSATRAPSGYYCPNPACPARVGQEFGHFAGVAGWTSRAPAGPSSSSSSNAGLRQAPRGLLPADRRGARDARPVRAQERREPVRGDPEARAAGHSSGSSPRSASHRWAGRRRSTWPPGWPSGCHRPMASR